VLWPAAIVLLVAAGCMALYFQRTTGKSAANAVTWFYREAAAVAPHFVFQSPRPDPAWNHDVLREFYISELHDYTVAREHPFQAALLKLLSWWRFYIGFTLTLPLIAFCFWKEALGAGAMDYSRCLSGRGHRAAGMVQPALRGAGDRTGDHRVTAGLHRIHTRSPWLVRTIALSACATVVVNASFESPDAPGSRWTAWGRAPAGFSRASLAAKLDAAEVNTSCWSTTFRITTSTESGSTTAPISIAQRSFGRAIWDPFRNTELLRHFQGRHVWLVEPDRTPPRVVPYPGDLIGDSDRLKRAILHAAPAAIAGLRSMELRFRPGDRTRSERRWPGCGAPGARDAKYSIDRWIIWMIRQQ